MSDMVELQKELGTIIADTGTPVISRATQLTDDIGGRFGDLADSIPPFGEIMAMAKKITSSGATEGENGVMWAEIIRLVHQILDS